MSAQSQMGLKINCERSLMPWARIQKIQTKKKGRNTSNYDLKMRYLMWPAWSTQELGTEDLNIQFLHMTI